MLSHSKIVVGAPDRHTLSPVTGVQDRAWKFAGPSFQIGEDSVPAFPAQFLEPSTKVRIMIHEPPGAANEFRSELAAAPHAFRKGGKASRPDGTVIQFDRSGCRRIARILEALPDTADPVRLSR
jgi:hypothetical protein